MAELSEAQKAEVVRRLACFDSIADIIHWLKAEEGVEAVHQQLVVYDPTRPCFRAGEKWRAIFEQARKAYLTEVAEVPIANQGFRLGELQRLYKDALKRKNTKQAMDVLEQAAKEMGGIYSNIRTLNMPLAPGAELSPVERRQELAKLINQSFGRPVGLVEGPRTAQ